MRQQEPCTKHYSTAVLRVQCSMPLLLSTNAHVQKQDLCRGTKHCFHAVDYDWNVHMQFVYQQHKSTVHNTHLCTQADADAKSYYYDGMMHSPMFRYSVVSSWLVSCQNAGYLSPVPCSSLYPCPCLSFDHPTAQQSTIIQSTKI